MKIFGFILFIVLTAFVRFTYGDEAASINIPEHEYLSITDSFHAFFFDSLIDDSDFLDDQDLPVETITFNQPACLSVYAQFFYPELIQNCLEGQLLPSYIDLPPPMC